MKKLSIKRTKRLLPGRGGHLFLFKYSLCLLVFFGLNARVPVMGQTTYAENTNINQLPAGIFYQAGPGANNTSYLWAYPYGSKLTINAGVLRNFEFCTTKYPLGQLEYRQWDYTNSRWIPWRQLVMADTLGNVLIGKTTQTNTSYKLDVNGNIRANKVVVNTTGADFVFDPAYQPPSLDSLRSFIKIHHHLPGIPAAAEMQQQGLDVGTNQALLLQKIEELMLYILRQDSVQQVLLNRLSQQQAQINALNHTRTLTGNKK